MNTSVAQSPDRSAIDRRGNGATSWRDVPRQVGRRIPPTWRAVALSVGLILLVMLAGCGSVTTSQPATIDAGTTGTPQATVGTGPVYDVEVVSASIPSLRPDVPADPADVYLPTAATGALPVALLLQGAGVARAAYADYARQVASYGFVVVVPDHQRLLFGTELVYAEQAQVSDVVAWMAGATTTDGAPLSDRLDDSTLVLMGHSFGGAAGLSAIENTCRIPFCIVKERDYPSRPPALKAGVFFGTNLASPTGDAIPAITTAGVPVGFVQGTLDTATTPAETSETIAKLSGGPVSLATIDGLDHFGITTTAPSFGDAPSTPTATPNPTPTATEQSRADGITTAARWTAILLHAALGNVAAEAIVAAEQSGASDTPNVTVVTSP